MGAEVFKKVFCTAVSALLFTAGVPFTASAADQQYVGNIKGYDYEWWNMNGTGEFSMEPQAGSFTCAWNNVENCIAFMGKRFDSQEKNYKDLGKIAFSYDLEIFPRGNVTFGAYGWTQNPLTEYYIINGWGDWRPSPNGKDLYSGTAVVNGYEYDVFRLYRFNQPTISGNRSFPSYYSVRTESSSQNNKNNYIKDVVDISKHFDSWEALGFDTSGTFYEAMFYVEGFRSSGTAVLKDIHIGIGADNTPVQVKSNPYYDPQAASDVSEPYAHTDLRGDVNCDGAIDVFDLTPLRKAILRVIFDDGDVPESADVNDDGDVNVADLVCLQRYLLGAEKTLDTETSAITDVTTATTTTTAASSASNTSAEKESYDFNAQYIFTHARKLFDYEDFPKTRIIGSRAELDEYIAENDENYDFYDKQNWFSDFSVPFSEAVEKYSDEWFETHKLVIILFRESFTNTKCHQVTKVAKDKIEIKRLKNGGDMAICHWHFLVEADKDADINDDFEVVVTDPPIVSDPSVIFNW